MKQHRFEVFIAVALTVICYFGDYYLKEPAITDITRNTLMWQTLNILWLLAMVIIGYWGLKDHEYKWVKVVWITVNSFLLILLLCNKILEHFLKHSFIPEGTTSVIRTPFFFLMAVFLPRWFMRHTPSKNT